MKTRHVITIGILSAVAIALLGIAVGLRKTNTVQTKAEYWYEDINQQYGQLKDYRIDGTTHSQDNTEQIDYQIQVEQEQTTIRVKGRRILNVDVLNSQNWQERTINRPLNEIDYIRIDHLASIYSTTLRTLSCTYRFYITDDEETFTTIQEIQWQTSTTTRPQTTSNVNAFTVERIDPTTTLTAVQNYGQEMYQTGATTQIDYNEVVDVRGLMYNILTMPFTFISQAFDVTLWQGTQYAINIGNFIKSILAISAILFIIKLFTSGFAVLGNYTPQVGNRTQTSKPTTKQTRKPTIAQKTGQKVMTNHDAKLEKKMNNGFRRG